MDNCDNTSRCHTPITIEEDMNALRWACTTCKESSIIRKDWRGVPENREFSRVYRKEILQPNQNLFYYYYSQHLRT